VQALASGVAHEIVPPAEVVPRAVALARELASKPPHAYAAVKRSLGRAYGEAMTQAGRGEAISQFMAFWEGAESREARAAVIARVTRK
jgi:enoyl-CoA hydratase/carnithine racemase